VLVGYSDSTWANARDNFRSVSGWIVGVINPTGKFNPVAWASKVQSRVAKSSNAAELLSAVDMSDVLMHVQGLFTEMGMRLKLPQARTDSNGVVGLCKPDSCVNPKDKSLICNVHVMRDRTREGSFEVVKVDRSVNFADELCKPTRCDMLRSLFVV